MENVILWNVTCFNIVSMEDYFNLNKMIKGVHNFVRRFAIILIIEDFIICFILTKLIITYYSC